MTNPTIYKIQLQYNHDSLTGIDSPDGLGWYDFQVSAAGRSFRGPEPGADLQHARDELDAAGYTRADVERQHNGSGNDATFTEFWILRPPAPAAPQFPAVLIVTRGPTPIEANVFVCADAVVCHTSAELEERKNGYELSAAAYRAQYYDYHSAPAGQLETALADLREQLTTRHGLPLKGKAPTAATVEAKETNHASRAPASTSQDTITLPNGQAKPAGWDRMTTCHSCPRLADCVNVLQRCTRKAAAMRETRRNSNSRQLYQGYR